MTGPLQKGHAMAALILGGIELLCGILVIILAVVSAKKADLPAAFSPWWAGVVFAIPGVVGVIVGITKNYCSMIAFMVLNIIAFIIQGVGAVLLGIAMVIFAAAASAIQEDCAYDRFNDVCRCTVDGQTLNVYGVGDCETLSSIVSMSVAIVVFLAIAACVSLAGSIVACCGTCCNNGQPQGGVVYK